MVHTLSHTILSIQTVDLCDTLVKLILGGIIVGCEVVILGALMYRYISRFHGENEGA